MPLNEMIIDLQIERQREKEMWHQYDAVHKRVESQTYILHIYTREQGHMSS